MIGTRYWEAPELTSVGRLPMHSVPPTNVLSLDGEWAFQLLPDPEAELGEQWVSVPVPGCWTMQDLGDPPIYTNVAMPFDEQPPLTPAQNPTGVYRRSFQLPGDWDGQRVVLHVGAAESVLHVTMNGSFVGLSKDSHLAAEFDLTRFLRAGDNELELRVVKWSDATYVEDQDQWWHAGITRSVLLYATDPLVHLLDVRFVPDVAADLTTAVLGVTVELNHDLLGAVVEVEVAELGVLWSSTDAPTEQLPDMSRVEQRAAVEEFFGHPPRAAESYSPTTAQALRLILAGHAPSWQVRCQLPVEGVELWSHESPRLYEVVVRLRDEHGTLQQTASYRVGFRRVEIRGQELLINGQPVLLRGVNRHDFDPHTGRVVTAEQMRAELVLLKQHGFNAIRTSHYPNDPVFLDLCDELGLYVVDEANIEAHAHRATLCDDPRYLSAWLDRVSRMVLRDKNHASVIMWSLGNESGYGTNHVAAAAWVRRYDPARPLHYEGAITLDWSGGRESTDVVCPMYSGISAIVEYATSADADRPLILCEFSHAMGNSNGSLADYWQAIETTHGLQGGFIWELWDHGLVQTTPTGTRWAYGGDFNEAKHDSNFCLDGMLFPDRTPKPAMAEHKQLAVPVTARLVAPELLEISNRQWFTGLEAIRARVVFSCDGDVVEERDLPLPEVAPRAAITLELREPAWPDVAGERWLHLTFTTSQQSDWAPAGFELGFAEIVLPSTTRPLPTRGAATSATVPAQLTLWRAPTDNDRWGGLSAQWDAAGLAELVQRSPGEYVTGRGDLVRVTTSAVALEDGGVRVEHTIVVPDSLQDLPRVGMILELDPSFDQVEWYGRGPHECYPDRQAGAALGCWSSAVDDLHVPYIRPQECGGRSDVRRLRLARPDGPDVSVELESPGQVSVSRYTAAELARATHHGDLTPHDRLVLTIDAAHRGLGTASCGPDALPQFRVGPGEYRLVWVWRDGP